MVGRVLAAMLLGACGGDSVCGPILADDPVDLRRVESCVSVEGELLIGAGFRDALSLPNLVEVRDGIAISDVADLDLPNLERVGFGVSRGSIRITGAAGRISAPRLASVGRGAFAEEDDSFLNDHGVYIRADAPTDIDLSALDNPGQILLEDIALEPNLGAVRTGDVTLLGALPASMAFPAVYGTLRVLGTSGMTQVQAGLPEDQSDIEVSNTADLTDVTLDVVDVTSLSLTNNARLQSVSLPSLQSLRVLAVEDNATDFDLDLGEVECVESVRWTRNAGEPSAQAVACQ